MRIVASAVWRGWMSLRAGDKRSACPLITIANVRTFLWMSQAQEPRAEKRM